MIIEMRTWARIGSSRASPRATAPLSVLQNSINSLHTANQLRKQELRQSLAQAAECDPIEPIDPDMLDGSEAADVDEKVNPGEVDDQTGAGDSLNR